MMEYYYPVIFQYPNIVSDEPTFEQATLNKAIENEDEDSGFHLGYFFSDEAKIEGDPKAVEFELKEKKKRNTRVKATDPSIAIPNDAQQIQSDVKIPYADTYLETNTILRTAVGQSDQLLSEIKEDIDSIRASKTLKNKYTYITNLSASAASLINTRIAAAREINNSITQAHNLELKRTKDLKEFARDDKNDDARMMDMYSAFINTPMGMYDNKLNMPSIPNMMLGVNDPSQGMGAVSLNANHDTTVTPEQLRMRMESNSNIREVVMYDAASGRKWFEVIDVSSGQAIPGYPTSDAFLLEDVSVDIRAGIARNRNLDKTWDLRTVGNVSEY